MNTSSDLIAYRPGHCALCDGPVGTAEIPNDVRLHLLGPTTVLTIECSIHFACLPEPVELPEATRALSARLISWYCSTPSVWPVLATTTGV
jgi:hypothetical protein